MNVELVAFFTDAGVPAAAMSPTPTIRIRRISDQTLVVTDALMTNIGDGFYNYQFTDFDPGEEYAVRAFANALSDAGDQYKAATIDSRGLTQPRIDVA